MIATVWFVRHGESTANAEGWLAGHRDVPLTPRGVIQAQALSGRLLRIRPRRVWSSDLRRAYRTAELAWGSDVERNAALRERNLGSWEGRPVAELRDSGEMASLLTWEGRPPEGESQRMVSQRVVTWLADHVDDGRDHLIFAHGGLIRCVVGLLDGTRRDRIGTWKVPNAELIERRVPQGTFRALRAVIGAPAREDK